MLVFILPSIVKLEHHHEHFKCKAKNEKHYHEFHQDCAVCNFEFSVFSPYFISIILQKEQVVTQYFCKYNSFNYSALSKYTLLLRGPPINKS